MTSQYQDFEGQCNKVFKQEVSFLSFLMCYLACNQAFWPVTKPCFMEGHTSEMGCVTFSFLTCWLSDITSWSHMWHGRGTKNMFPLEEQGFLFISCHFLMCHLSGNWVLWPNNELVTWKITHQKDYFQMLPFVSNNSFETEKTCRQNWQIIFDVLLFRQQGIWEAKKPCYLQGIMSEQEPISCLKDLVPQK